jgi:tetratricopeptide (TPR) repeat protein
MTDNPYKVLLRVLTLSFLAWVGCESKMQDSNQPATARSVGDSDKEIPPIDAARQAFLRQDLSTAQEQIRQALIASPQDVESLQLAAEIANAKGDHQAAIGWMIEVARQGDFADASLLQQCVMQLLTNGMLFETIELLEEVVQKQPKESEIRRNLLQFLINAEQHDRAQFHGRVLIQQRAFDKTMLFLMATYEQRDLPPNTLNELFLLNPSDNKLQIAKLRVLFDNGQWDQFKILADQILASSPNFVPAQLLLGQYYVQTDQFERLGDWRRSVSPAAEQHWQYWAVLGDWAMNANNYPQAARAYFEASRRDPAIASVATKLAQSLQLCTGPDFDDAKLSTASQAASERGELLARFLQEKERYRKLQRRSNAAIAQMARTLEKLGRLWEAEAWTAVGLVEPDEAIDELNRVRKRIIDKLRNDTPWQLEEAHPFLSLDLTFLPLPLDGSEGEDPTAETIASARRTDFVPSALPKLVNQSEKRGLVDHPRAPTTVGDGVIPLFSQLGFGGAALDFDCDGWTDIYVASCGQEPMSLEEGSGRLFRNVAGQFDDCGDVATIHDVGFAQGVATGDINEDGFDDLVLLNYGFDQVFVNNGDGTFSEKKNWIRDGQHSWSTSGAIADIDLDGISDFVCLKYCKPDEPLITRCTIPGSSTIDYCVPTHFAADLDVFYRGQASGSWVNANQRWNATPTSPGRGLGLVVGQLDNLPGTDVFVANDMTSNHFWSAEKHESFAVQETATVRGLALDERSRPQASMGVAAGDFDTDGDVDFFVTNFEFEHNTLYEQQHLGVWKDISRKSRLIQSSFQRLGFGAQAIDLDNDSQLELVVANGHVHHDAESGYAQHPQILRRAARGGFEPLKPSDFTGYFSNRHVGRALWCLDFDRDRLVDLVATHQREPTALLHNQTPGAENNHWIRVSLVGTNSARDAIGSVVSVSYGGKRATQPVVAGDGFFCSSEDALHFGLGASSSDDGFENVQIDVRWPEGKTQMFQTTFDQECLIIEGDPEVFVYSIPETAFN